MGERYKGEYSETDWEDEFLAEVRSQISDADRPRFLGLLRSKNIQKEEAKPFFEAFMNGKEKEFLEKREAKEKGIEHIIPLPEEERIHEEEQHKTAA